MPRSKTISWICGSPQFALIAEALGTLAKLPTFEVSKERKKRENTSSQHDGAVQGLTRETPTAKPVAFIGILARHTHKFIFAIGSKALWRLQEEEEEEELKLWRWHASQETIAAQCWGILQLFLTENSSIKY